MTYYKNKEEVISYLIGQGAKHIENDIWKLKSHKILIMKDRSFRYNGWTFGYL